MSFREVLVKVTAASAGAALVAASATGVAQAGQKITPESFGMHSTAQEPGVFKGSIRMNGWPTWRLVEPKQGQYDWSQVDTNLDLVESWGYSDVLFVISGTPEWAGSAVKYPERELPGPFYGPGSTSAPSNMSYYRDYVTALIEKFGDRIDSYQAWNEITSPQFYQGTPKQMASMTKILNQVVNKKDPSATVLSGSVQTHAQWAYDNIAVPYFKALGAKGWPVDVVSGHFYPLGKGGPDRRIQQIMMFQKDVERYGRPSRVKMWDTEANFWTTVANKTPPNPDGRVRGTKAATYVARNYLDTWRTGLQRSYWYIWTVGSQDLGFPGIQMRSDLKPAREAYNNLASWTSGGKLKKCTTTGNLVECSFVKGSAFTIAFTTKGKATAKFSGTRSVTPVYGGGTVTAKGKTPVGTLPVRIG